MKILPNETLISGKWVVRGGQTVGDETCKRIEELVRSHLRLLGRDPSGWDALYRDPADGRLWELTHPQSECHGGGPPQLRWMPVGEAQVKYEGIDEVK